jgi:uncharacterized protein (DUF1800 family)
MQKKQERERLAAAAKSAPAPPKSPGSPAGDGTMAGGAVPSMTATPTNSPASANEKPKAAEPPPAQKIFRADAMARFQRVVHAQVGFVERLVHFWSNHFCVSAAKSGLVRAAVGSFEREAIRPHVLGRFADMLKAVESHPAMLAYLDNAQSFGPHFPGGSTRQARSQREPRTRDP